MLIGRAGRGHRPATFAAVCAVALAAVLASAARGATLAASTPPLAGSSFQGGDGNQDDQPPNLVDWQGLQSTGRVVHSADPNAADSAFAGGAKGRQAGSVGPTTKNGGVKPGQGQHPRRLVGGRSARRESRSCTSRSRAQEANGTTFLTFELNQDARLWNNGRAQIPCRRTGDLLVVLRGARAGTWTSSFSGGSPGDRRGHGLRHDGGVSTRWRAIPAATLREPSTRPDPSRLPGFYPASNDSDSAVRRGGAEPQRAAGRRRSTTVLRVRSIWMHSRSSHVGVLADGGLRRPQRWPAHMRGRGNEVL